MFGCAPIYIYILVTALRRRVATRAGGGRAGSHPRARASLADSHVGKPRTCESQTQIY